MLHPYEYLHALSKKLSDEELSYLLDLLRKEKDRRDADDNDFIRTSNVPPTFPVKALRQKDIEKYRSDHKEYVTCGTCGLSWDDSISTSYTPAPSARCPFEYFHKGVK